MTFRSLVSQGSRLSCGRRAHSQGDLDTGPLCVSDHFFDAMSIIESHVGERRNVSGSSLSRFPNANTAKNRQMRRDEFDNLRGLEDDIYHAHMRPAPGKPGAFEV